MSTWSVDSNPPPDDKARTLLGEATGWEGDLLGDLFPNTLLAPGEHPFGSRSVYTSPTMHIDPAIYPGR